MGNLVLGQGRLGAVSSRVGGDLVGAADASVLSSVAVRGIFELLDELVGVDLRILVCGLLNG